VVGGCQSVARMRARARTRGAASTVVEVDWWRTRWDRRPVASLTFPAQGRTAGGTAGRNCHADIPPSDVPGVVVQGEAAGERPGEQHAHPFPMPLGAPDPSTSARPLPPPPPPPAYICVPYHPRRFCRHSRSGLGYRPAPRLYRQVGVEVRGAFVSWPWQHRLGRYADSFTTRPRSHQGREPTLATPSDTPTFVRYAARTPHSVALCAPFPADGRARSPDCGPRSSALLLVGVSSGWTAGGSRRDGTAPLTE
jgi:hypothetical protein